ncbi:MAG TPA: dTMP kinase [Actinomycetota bacterium]
MVDYADEIAALRGTKPATFGSLFKNRSFFRLWRAMLVSSLGDWTGFVAITALVTRIGGPRAGYAVTGVMLARLLPSLIFGPVAGVFVDRFDRRKLMVIADIGRGAGYVSMAFVGELWLIYALSFSVECLSLLWTPARDASIPNIVSRRQLSNANSMGLFTSYGTLPLGGILFTALTALATGIGGVIEYFGDRPESLALLLNSVTFAFSAWMIWGLQLPERSRRAQGRLRPAQAWDDLREGIRFLRAHAFQRTMTIGVVLAFTGVGSVIALGPIFAQNTLGAGQAGWGIVVTSVGLGLAAGMISVGLVERVIDKETLFPLAMIGAAGLLVVLSLMPNIALAAMLTAVMGSVAGLAWVAGYTLLHENVGDEFRGRTFATLTILSRLGLLASLAGFPALAQTIGDYSIGIGDAEIDLAGTRLALWVGAAVVLVGGVSARRGLRRGRRSRAQPLQLRPQLRRGERPGTFIVFEGVEGSGKGTQVELAKDFLEGEGYEVLVTREPGGTPLGEGLREVLLGDQPLDARAEALLFAAGRAQHAVAVIRPALEKGKVVLCDRYVDSSLAYQGVGRDLGEPDVLALSAWATQGLFPDLVILLNIDPEEGLERSGGDDRFESEGDEFHEKVAEAYLRIADEHPERVVVVDALGTPEEVHGRVRDAIRRFLKGQEEA